MTNIPKKMRFINLFICFFCVCYLNAQHLRINEIMASNFNTVADEDGDYEDWIEIYNGTDSIVNLKGFALSDKLTEPLRWIFPEVLLQPDTYLLIFASDKNRYGPNNLHTNFKISISGEYIVLSDSLGNIVDIYPPVSLTTDNSFGRFPDGCDNLMAFSGATPGYSNNTLQAFEPYSESLTFSHPQGFYTSPIHLSIAKTNPNTEIRFTTNGSDPDTLSNLYEAPIYIQNKFAPINGISYIPTTSPFAQHPFHWRTPKEVYKASIFKVRAFDNGKAVSPVYTATYFVNEHIFQKYNNLPIISLITDSVNLFDYESGIFVPGKLSDDNPQYPDWWGYGNFFGRGIEWERPAHLTFFEGNGTLAFAQNIGIRNHGQSSRALPEKSLRLYARNIYGQKYFNYKFFPWNNVSQYSRIILRNGGNDFPFNMFGDGLAALATKNFNFENREYRPAITFINGEFWGLHNIRERIDDSYFEYAFNLTPDDIDYLIFWDYATIGSADDFHALMHYVTKNDLTDNACYDYISELMDIDNFIDYVIAKHYVAVYDWPGNNVTIWRNKANNGKWRWMFFDNDNCFENYAFNAIEHSTVAGNTNWPNPDISTLLLRNLFKNKNFRQEYLKRFEYYLLNDFSETSINSLIDSITNLIGPIMREHINRWQYPLTLTEWEKNVQKIRAFAKLRPCYIKEHLYSFFNITDSTYMASICTEIIIPEDSIIPLPISDIEKNISLYPNPTKDLLYINFSGYNTDEASCVLLDITGRILFSQVIKLGIENEITLSLSGYAKGIYILKIFSDKAEFKKIVLE